MQYIILETITNRALVVAKSGMCYSLSMRLDEATPFDWAAAVSFYNHYISKKRRPTFAVTYADARRQSIRYRPKANEMEPVLPVDAAEPAPVPLELPPAIPAEGEGPRGIFFMVDYENVGEAGLTGVEYLVEQDSVTLFYGGSSSSMKKRSFQALADSGCSFDICALSALGKNALDFYLVSRIGEVFGDGYGGPVCIVSGDSGFHAVSQYWAIHALHPRTVFCASSLENGILALDGRSARARDIREYTGKVSISTEFARYDERRKLRERLTRILEEIDCADRLEEAELLLREQGGKKIVYLSALHRFGRQRGLTLYNSLKAEGFL